MSRPWGHWPITSILVVVTDRLIDHGEPMMSYDTSWRFLHDATSAAMISIAMTGWRIAPLPLS
jgi:hypothetical protein